MDSNSDFLPDCWNDDERMGYLFSGFRENRQVNPRDWDNKLKFWSDLAANSGRSDKTIILSLDGLSQKFRRKGVVPKCLNGVLKEMHRNGQIIRVDDLKASTTWWSWGVNTLIRRPLKWTVTSFFNQVDAPMEEEYVAVELLKENGEAFLKRHQQNVQCASTDHLVDYSTFKEECADLCGDETSFDLVLSYLQMNKEILISTDDNTRVIKFASKGQKVIVPITPTELGTLRLKKTILLMQLTIERISTSIQQHASETRQCLKKGMRSSAKNALRRKKLAQKRLESTESTLDALQQLQDRLQSAESEKMVLDAYKAGAGALKKTFADTGLTPEAVDDAISDVQEVMEMCNEIDDTIVQGNKSIDDTVHFGADIAEDLEAELESLIGDDGSSSVTRTSPSAEGKHSFLHDLPDVPSTSPTAARLSDREGSIRESLVSS